MSRYVPMLMATVLVAGTMVAEAHQPSPQSAGQRALAGRAGYPAVAAGYSAAQTDDIAAKVKAALKADADLGSASDAVTVTGAAGVVTLEGTVPSVQIRAKLGEFVMKIDGVSKLVNKLKLAKK